VTANGSGSIPLGPVNSTFTAPYDSHIATVNIPDNQTNVKPADILLPTSLIPERDLNLANVTNHRVLNFSSNDRDWIYMINNTTFDHNRVDITAKLGTVEEWKLVNLDKVSSGNIHPFHIHVNDFQVMSVNGKPYDAHGYQDTVIIPTGGEVGIFWNIVGIDINISYPVLRMWHKNRIAGLIKYQKIFNPIINIHLAVSNCTVDPETYMITGEAVKTHILYETFKSCSFRLKDFNIIGFSTLNHTINRVEIKKCLNCGVGNFVIKIPNQVGRKEVNFVKNFCFPFFCFCSIRNLTIEIAP
jgi:hypothetical protein